MAHEYTHAGLGEDKRVRIPIIKLDADYDPETHADVHSDTPDQKRTDLLLGAHGQRIESLELRVSALEADNASA